MNDLRKWAYDATKRDQRELYALAAEARISSYELTRWMRNECELDRHTLSRVFVALRKRPVRSRPKERRRKQRPPMQVTMF